MMHLGHWERTVVAGPRKTKPSVLGIDFLALLVAPESLAVSHFLDFNCISDKQRQCSDDHRVVPVA